MKKVALVFVQAVFVPSLVLAWLAVRSLRDQQFILERQQSLLYQGIADAKAKDVQDALAEYQHSFAAQVAKLLGKRDPQEIAGSFDDSLRRDWPLAQVGFCVSLAGEIKAPASYGRAESRKFLADNGRFLANRESVDVYTNPKQLLANASSANYLNAQPQPSSSPQTDLQNDTSQRAGFNKFQQRSVSPQQQALSSQRQDPAEQAQQQFSKAAAAPAEFRQLIGDDNEGTVARFVDNKLNVLIWYRSPRRPATCFRHPTLPAPTHRWAQPPGAASRARLARARFASRCSTTPPSPSRCPIRASAPPGSAPSSPPRSVKPYRIGSLPFIS